MDPVLYTHYTSSSAPQPKKKETRLPQPTSFTIPRLEKTGKKIYTTPEGEFQDWLKDKIAATPDVPSGLRLQQMIAILEAEIYILKNPGESPWKNVCESIKFDLNFIKAISEIVYLVKTNTASSIVIENKQNEDIKRLINCHSQTLAFLRKKRCEPLSKAFTFEQLYGLFDTRTPDEVCKILAIKKNDFRDFLMVADALVSCYPNPETTYLYLFHERAIAIFLPEVDAEQLLKIFKDSFTGKDLLHALYTDIRSEVKIPPKARLKTFRSKQHLKQFSLEQLKLVENSLTFEAKTMNRLLKMQEGFKNGYSEYTKLVHLKFRNCISCLDSSKTRRIYFYPIDKLEWENLDGENFLIKTELDQINLPQNELSRIKDKGQTHFISLKMEYDQDMSSCINFLKQLQSKAANPAIYESLQASCLLNNKDFTSKLENGLEKFLKEISETDICCSTLSVFLNQVGVVYASAINNSEFMQNQLGYLPPLLFREGLFNCIFPLIENWRICRDDQNNLKKFVSHTIQCLLKKQQGKAHAAPPPTPVAPVEKKSVPKTKIPVLKKIAETGKQLFSKKDSKPAISPDLYVQALQQKFNHKTTRVTATTSPPLIKGLPGKPPTFTKLNRVSRWEEVTVDLPDLLDWKEELRQYVYHIPHALIDRYIHLGIKGTREGCPCISIPAEITFDNEAPIRGTIGYTFGADGVCFHRHFTNKTLEPQKKEASGYAQFPTLNSAYAEALKHWFIEEYQCKVMEDVAGNVTFKHTQTATCAGHMVPVPVTIKIFNAAGL